MTTTGYVGHTEARVKIILGSVHLPLSFIHSGPKGWRRAPHTSAFRQREALTWLFSFGSLLLGDCVLEERSYDGIWRRRGAKGGSFKPAGHLPFTTAFWLAARKVLLLLHSTVSMELKKSWCYQKHADSQSESEWRGGGEDEGTGTVVPT